MDSHNITNCLYIAKAFKRLNEYIVNHPKGDAIDAFQEQLDKIDWDLVKTCMETMKEDRHYCEMFKAIRETDLFFWSRQRYKGELAEEYQEALNNTPFDSLHRYFECSGEKKQNGKPVDLLNSLEMFAETMEERYHGYNSSLLAIASNGDQSLLSSFGSDDAIIDALSTILYQNSEFFAIVQNAIGLAIAAKYKTDSIVNDAE